MNTAPDAGLSSGFRRAGGEGKPCYGKVDLCWAATEEEARRVAYETWPNTGLPGELAQVLPTARRTSSRRATSSTEEWSPRPRPHGPDRQRGEFQEFPDAGYDRVVAAAVR